MTESPSPALLDDLAEHLTLGVSLYVATRDADLRLELCRCAGARLGSDGLVRVAVPIPEGERALANVTATGVVALTSALPTTYRTLQVKGTDARPVEWPELEEVVRLHGKAFTTELEEDGVVHLVDRLWSNHFRCIAFTPAEIFDQTPGPAPGI